MPVATLSRESMPNVCRKGEAGGTPRSFKTPSVRLTVCSYYTTLHVSPASNQ